MGYNDALKDGIRISENRTMNFYYPLCHKCGTEIKSMNYLSYRKYTCEKCKALDYISDKQKKVDSSHDAKEKKFNNAVKRIEKSVKNIKKYEDAILVVHDKLHNDGWFDSTEEIMVAIELVKNRVMTKHQVKFGRYKVDFVLPEMKVILEVDGELYHTDKTKEKETIRDSLIVAALGGEWEVIRISDVLINQNIKQLVPAIKKAVKARKETRAENSGMLPKGYTRIAV